MANGSKRGKIRDYLEQFKQDKEPMASRGLKRVVREPRPTRSDVKLERSASTPGPHQRRPAAPRGAKPAAGRLKTLGWYKKRSK